MAETTPRAGVPVMPCRRRHDWSALYHMEVGESFLSDAIKPTLYGALRRCTEITNRKFTARQMGENFRIWRTK